MRRLTCALYLISLLAFCGLSSPSLGDEGSPSTCKLAQELRLALGFGPSELAALGVNEATHATIAEAAETFCVANRQTLLPLLENVRTARQAAFREYERGDGLKAGEKEEDDIRSRGLGLSADADVSASDQTFRNAVSTLASSCSDVLTTMSSALSDQQRVLHARLAGNRPLDVNLGLF